MATDKTTILGISGSLRKDSYNSALLRIAVDLLPEGAELQRYDELELLPPYNEDKDAGSPPETAVRFRELVTAADAVLIVTPEYNGSIPGQLKNAVDWASRPREAAPLADKPVAAIGASISPNGALWAQQDLRKSLGVAGARVLEQGLSVGPTVEKISIEEGRLLDLDLERQLLDVISSLLALTETVSAVRE